MKTPTIPMDTEPVCRVCGREHALPLRVWQCNKCGDLVCFAQLWVNGGTLNPVHQRRGELCGPVRGEVLAPAFADPP